VKFLQAVCKISWSQKYDHGRKDGRMNMRYDEP